MTFIFDTIEHKDNITILDGGMGHELKLRGVSDGTFLAGVLANEKKNCNNDYVDVVESIHEDYLVAGCDIITTNSFVAVPQRMIECGLATDEEGANKRASQLIQAAVDRAKSAITKYNHNKGDGSVQKKIAGCVPPLSECYFANKVSPDLYKLISEYRIILTSLLDCKVDILLAETLSKEQEAVAILHSLSNTTQQKKSENISLPPIWISFTIHDDKPTNLRSDETLEDVCKSIIQEASKLNLPLQVIGVNCSTPTAISTAIPILAKVTEGTNIKVSAYGNCFQTTTSEWMNSLDDNGDDVQDDTTKMIKIDSLDYDEEGYLTPDAYTKFTLEWIKSGAQIIGGCCGSRPAHMHKVAAAIKSK